MSFYSHERVFAVMSRVWIEFKRAGCRTRVYVQMNKFYSKSIGRFVLGLQGNVRISLKLLIAMRKSVLIREMLG
jgi:hypothetical protein